MGIKKVMPKAFGQKKQLTYKEKKNMRRDLDFFKAIIVDWSQVYDVSNESRPKFHF